VIVLKDVGFLRKTHCLGGVSGPSGPIGQILQGIDRMTKGDAAKTCRQAKNCRSDLWPRLPPMEMTTARSLKAMAIHFIMQCSYA